MRNIIIGSKTGTVESKGFSLETTAVQAQKLFQDYLSGKNDASRENALDNLKSIDSSSLEYLILKPIDEEKAEEDINGFIEKLFTADSDDLSNLARVITRYYKKESSTQPPETGDGISIALLDESDTFDLDQYKIHDNQHIRLKLGLTLLAWHLQQYPKSIKTHLPVDWAKWGLSSAISLGTATYAALQPENAPWTALSGLAALGAWHFYRSTDRQQTFSTMFAAITALLTAFMLFSKRDPSLLMVIFAACSYVANHVLYDESINSLLTQVFHTPSKPSTAYQKLGDLFSLMLSLPATYMILASMYEGTIKINDDASDCISPIVITLAMLMVTIPLGAFSFLGVRKFFTPDNKFMHFINPSSYNTFAKSLVNGISGIFATGLSVYSQYGLTEGLASRNGNSTSITEQMPTPGLQPLVQRASDISGINAIFWICLMGRVCIALPKAAEITLAAFSALKNANTSTKSVSQEYDVKIASQLLCKSKAQTQMATLQKYVGTGDKTAAAFYRVILEHIKKNRTQHQDQPFPFNVPTVMIPKMLLQQCLPIIVNLSLIGNAGANGYLTESPSEAIANALMSLFINAYSWIETTVSLSARVVNSERKHSSSNCFGFRLFPRTEERQDNDDTALVTTPSDKV